MDLSHPHTRLLIDVCRDHGLLRNQCAYVLATAWHETGKYRWLREIWGPTAQQKKYDPPGKLASDLGNTTKGDGKKFMGRGFVHITGRRNYLDWSRRLGLDLIKEPATAEKPAIAARIIAEGMKLGTFTTKKLDDYVTLQRSDFVGARCVVNGQDKAELIAGYARQFDALLKAAGYGEGRATDAPKPAPATQTPASPQPASARPAGDEREFSIIAAIAAAVTAVGGSILFYFFGG